MKEMPEIYRTWDIHDPEYNKEEAWPASSFTDARLHYMWECGCAVTSLAIMLKRFDIEKEDDPDKFNPWILNQRLLKCCAFDRCADLYLEQINNLYPLEVAANYLYSREKLVEVYNSGLPFMIVVLSDTPARHFVVPDYLTDDDLAVIDCADPKKKFLSHYTKVYEIRVFRPAKKAIDPAPMVALTFDDGPSCNGISDRICDILEKYKVKATFFEVGQMATYNPDNIKRKIKLGYEIGTHTWDHKQMGDELTEENIYKGYQTIADIAGTKPTCFRAPGGYETDKTADFCKRHDLPLFKWTVDTMDWKNRDADTIFDVVMSKITNGGIILMHELYPSTADALDRLIPELINKGFKFVTCSELIRLKTGKDPEPGVSYMSAFINDRQERDICKNET